MSRSQPNRHPIIPRPLIALAAIASLVAVTSCGSSAVRTGSPAPQTSQRPAALQPATRENLLTAMHGEAFAHAKYLAYAAVATDPSRAQLFRRTANVERRQHFAEEAALEQLVGTNRQNLKDAIAGENYETTTMYPDFANQARAKGDTAAAARFTELATDEAGHRDTYQKALQALNAGSKVPEGPAAEPTAITTGAPDISAATRANLSTAMHGEAFAFAKYMLYAQHAQATGNEELAHLFEHTAQVELRQHFAEEANLAGLARDDAANLKDSVNGEDYETTTMYPGFAKQAGEAGDSAAADRFAEIGSDEAGHRDGYQAALQRMPS